MAFIKACSEAIFFGVAHCIKQESSLALAIRENLHPIANRGQVDQGKTKLLVNILTGGKSANSQVKFGNFYLIIDGHQNAQVNITGCFRALIAHLKSKFPTGKGGDSAFKVLPDGSYFNAYTSITDSFKFLEEAIQISNANAATDGRPGTNPASTGRIGTALSGKSKDRIPAGESTIGDDSQAPAFDPTKNCF